MRSKILATIGLLALPLTSADAADSHYYDFVPALTTATAPGATDWVAIIQGGVSKKTNLSLSTLGLAAGNGIAISSGTVSTALTNTAGSKTTDYTVVAGDMGGVIGLSGSSAHNLTLPAISSTIFANNMSVCYNVEGTGTWTIVNSTGGSLLGLPSTTIPQYAGGCFWSDGANLHWNAGAAGGTLQTVRSIGAEFSVASGVLDIATNGITLAMLPQAGAHTLRGNNSGSTANVADQSSFSITAASAINANAASLLTAQTGTLMQIANADGTATRYEADAFGAQAFFSAVTANGTKASPTTIVSATQLGGFNFHGYDATSYVGPVGTFRCYGNQTWTSSAHGTYCTIATTANGTTTLTDALKFEHDGGMTTPSVTGGDKGVGTINAAGLYVNGTAVITTSTGVKNFHLAFMTSGQLQNTTKFYVFDGSVPTNSNDTSSGAAVPSSAGVWQFHSCSVPSAPASGQTLVLTLRAAAVSQSATCTITGPATTGVVSGTYTAADGVLMSIQGATSATSGTVIGQWNVEFDPT